MGVTDDGRRLTEEQGRSDPSAVGRHPSSVKAAAVQMDIILGDVEGNQRRILERLDEAAGRVLADARSGSQGELRVERNDHFSSASSVCKKCECGS